ncbi:hypothetical protein H8E07_19150, partial [bacterium]|nr:hypothetical protein [bacterium]
VREVVEEVFNRRACAGRSGVMFSYEGLGCIYWHMVAKLMLAVQEIVVRADREDVPEQVRDDLARMYFRIRSGLGYEKTVAEYGAFPSDPYSHTPRGGGAKQPGMTGQVKEEILTRIGELGVRIDMGVMSFDAALLRPDEFTRQPTEFRYFDVFGRARSLSLSAGCLAFTYCQVPIIYERVAKTPCISIVSADGSSVEKSSTELDSGTSAKIFSRSGLISMIRVGIPDIALCRH